MKRKVKALLALALTLALVSTTLGDSWLYVSAENAAETEEQADEPEAVVEEDTEEKPAEIVEEAPQEEVVPAAEEVSEAEPGEEQTEETPAPAEEPEQAAENTQPAEQPTDQTPSEQPAETPAQTEDQEQPADAAAPSETPAADVTGEADEKAPEAEAPGTDGKATETAATEISLTEQTIEASVDTEEKDVVITLTGEMPEGATVNACPVDVSMDGINIITAYDITIYDAEGQEFQPSEEKPFQVKIEDDAVRKALEENAELEVYHLEDAEAEPEQVQDVNLEAAAVEFQAESFSIYVVGTHWTHTYQFLDEDGNAIDGIVDQILSVDEKLKEPKSPTKEHAVFEGWYTAKSGGEKFTGFEQPEPKPEDEKKSITTQLYARFTTVYYVYYRATNNEQSKVLWTQTYHDGSAEITTSDVPFTPESTDDALIGWTKVLGGTEPMTSLSIDNDDVILYPVVKKAHWLNYHSMGGTSVEPVYVLSGGKTQDDQRPTRKGYTFDGWYVDPECTRKFVFGNTLEADQDLYASWKPAQVEYTVVYWLENADDNDYSYEASEKKQGLTGSEATYDKTKTFDYFTLNTEKTDAEKVTISADGNSIKNVYYSRNVYTIKFVGDVLICDKEEHKHSRACGWRPFGGYQCGKEEHTHNENCYERKTIRSVSQKYDSDISRIWEEDPIKNLLDEGNVWKSSATGYYYSFLQKMPYQDITMTQTQWSGPKYTWYYYLETLDGKTPNGETPISNGDRTYYLYHTSSALSNNGLNLTYDEDYFELTGFTQRDPEVPEFDRNRTASLYYLRKSYEIDFHTNNENSDVIKKSGILYESDLSNIAPTEYEVGKTTKVLNGVTYYFDGWYDNQYLQGKAYDFTGKKMPAKNLAYYAKWSTRQVKLSFDSMGGTEIKEQILDQGATGTKPDNPTRNGFKFAGWVKKDGTPFSFATAIMEDTTIYAKWISNSQYTITYDPGAGFGDAVIDMTGYVNGAEVKLKNVPEGFKPPAKYYGFVCWNTEENGSGTDYYPGAGYIMPEKNVTLYAKWAPIRETTLSYDYNGGTFDGKAKSEDIKIEIPNSEYAIDDRIPTRDGYEFLGWSITVAGSTLLKAGDKIQADTLDEDSNVLYAQWRKLKEVTFTVEKLVEGNMGEHNREFEFAYSIVDKEGTEKGKGTFKLKSGEKYAQIPPVAEGYTIVIQETSVTGYTTTIASDNVKNASSTTGEFRYTVTKDSAVDSTTVTYTNSKTMGTPTGVTTNWMSSILMLLAGFGMAVVMLLTGKRRKI